MDLGHGRMDCGRRAYSNHDRHEHGRVRVRDHLNLVVADHICDGDCGDLWINREEVDARDTRPPSPHIAICNLP